jgi:hypothetical protein
LLLAVLLPTFQPALTCDEINREVRIAAARR